MKIGCEPPKFDPSDNAVISSGEDNFLIFWDAATGEFLDAIDTEHTGGVYDISFSFNGQFLATAGVDGRVIVWSLAQRGGRLAIISAHQGSVWGVDFSPNDFRLLSASDDYNVILSQLSAVEPPGSIRFDTNQSISEFEIDQNTGVFVLAGEPVGQMSSMLQVWDSVNDVLSYEIDVQDISEVDDLDALTITDLALSLDGTLGAFSLASGEVAVWAMRDGALQWTHHLHSSIVKEIEFTPDGSQLISADETGEVIISNVSNGEAIETALYASGRGVTAMMVSPDGQYLAIGGARRHLVMGFE